MPGGGLSSQKHHKSWKKRKLESGCRQVNAFLPKEIVGPLESIAKEEMLPFATAMEIVLADALGVRNCASLPRLQIKKD